MSFNVQIDQSKINEKLLNEAKANRANAYAQESDPLFFKAQRGEATIEEWEAKVAEIRNRYPYPELDGQVWDDIINEWKPEQTDTINTNTADFDTLRALHGVDEVRAQAIIDGRPWADVNDLTTIQGISQEMVDSWDITV